MVVTEWSQPGGYVVHDMMQRVWRSVETHLIPTCGTQGHGLLHLILHSHIMLFILIHLNILTPEG
jgi:hypothetical protein